MTDIQIAKLNLEIAEHEDWRTQWLAKVQSADSQYILATLGVIIGLLLVIFTSYWWLGLLLFMAGTLAVFTQGFKKRKAQKEVDLCTKAIREKRAEISSLLDRSPEG